MPVTKPKLLQDKDRIEAALKKAASPLSAASFVNIFIWQDFFDFECRTIEGNVCVFASNEVGTFLYVPPLGETLSLRAIEHCFSIMHERNQGNSVSRIENVPQAALKYFDANRFSFYAKSPDYLYRREDIASFKGNPFKSPRWAYNRFARDNRHEFRAYEPSMLNECLGLFERWAEERAGRNGDPVYRQMLQENEKVHERILTSADELGIIGRVVRVEGQIAGYTFGHALDEKTFVVLCEVTDLSLKGIPAFIFRELCRDPALAAFEVINAMDDSDMANIRRTKLSFNPIERVANYAVSLKENL